MSLYILLQKSMVETVQWLLQYEHIPHLS